MILDRSGTNQPKIQGEGDNYADRKTMTRKEAKKQTGVGTRRCRDTNGKTKTDAVLCDGFPSILPFKGGHFRLVTIYVGRIVKTSIVLCHYGPIEQLSPPPLGRNRLGPSCRFLPHSALIQSPTPFYFSFLRPFLPFSFTLL